MMDCLHPMAPPDEELLGFALDGSPLSEPMSAHLGQCEICQKRLANVKQLNSALLAKVYRRLCPSGTQLSMYCEGLLPPDEMTPIAMHVRDCPLCTSEVADTRRFMEAASLDDIVAPFSVREAVRRVMAKLVRQQAQLVTRGGEDATERGWPRQYRADEVDLSLHLSRASSGAYMLLGILTSVDNQESVDAFEGARTELYAATDEDGEEEAQAVCRAMVDDLGNIVFKSVPVGSYTLILHLPVQDVVIEGLAIEHG